MKSIQYYSMIVMFPKIIPGFDRFIPAFDSLIPAGTGINGNLRLQTKHMLYNKYLFHICDNVLILFVVKYFF